MRTKNLRYYVMLSGAALIVVAMLLAVTNMVTHANTRANDVQHQTYIKAHGDSEIFNGDLTVEAGEIHRGDIILYSGDLIVKENGIVEGSLLVYSGDIEIETGATVVGDIVGLSGDASVAGHVQGSVVIWSGDIHLEENSVVRGDISVMSGDIHREDTAMIEGNIIAGPKFPKMPNILEQFNLEQLNIEPPLVPSETSVIRGISPPVTTPNDMNYLTRLILRLVAGALLTGLVVLMTGLTFYLQPTFITNIQSTVSKQRPVGFVVGLGLNLLLIMFMSLAISSDSIFLALCLAPLSLLAFILFLIINTGGWAALSMIIGSRVLAKTQMEMTQPLAKLAVGAILMTGSLSFVWALGGCLRPISYLAALTLLALGSGAFVMQQYQRNRSAGTGDASVSAV